MGEVVECPNCGGEGVDGHDCGEDTCVCLDKSDNVECWMCGGSGHIKSQPSDALSPDPQRHP